MKIVADAGHSYETAGKRTIDGSMREWEFNNAVANYLKKNLEQYRDVEVLFAHDPSGKIDIPLDKRTDYANKIKADCFISIHANAFGTSWNDANGIETFVYKKNFALKDAVKLAGNVQNALVKHSGLRDRGVKEGNFAVLRDTKMTSILIECGFMTNRKEAELLKSDNYRQVCAFAICEGIAQTYNLVKKVNLVEKPYEPLFKPSTNALKNGFKSYLQSAIDKKIIHSTEGIEKLDQGTLLLSDAVGYIATIEDRKNKAN